MTAATINLQDQGCPTDATTANFFVNSGGELWRDNQYLDAVSGLNLVKVAEKYGFDWSEVCAIPHDGKSDLAKKWRATQEQEWQVLYQKHLTLVEHAFVKKVCRFQDATDFGRFRAYGELRNRTENIVVVTEFKEFIDDELDFWEQLAELVRKIKAHYWVMDETTHNDHSTTDYGTPKQKEYYGPDHGRPTRQVELSWAVQDLTIPQVKRLIERLKKQTQKLWRYAGVGVC